MVFHGTSKDKDFSRFKSGQRGSWFDRDPAVASEYAVSNDSKGPVFDRYSGKIENRNTSDRVIPSYLDIKNPYVPSPEDAAILQRAENYARTQRDMFNKAKMAGHDGADMGGGTLVAFSPDQIHNGISSPVARGKFLSENPHNLPQSEFLQARGEGLLNEDAAIHMPPELQSLLRDIASRYSGGKP
jgi:hypothetical protein